MKAYLTTTGIVFALLTVAHIWRITVESAIARDPWFIMTTVISTALCIWAFRLLRQHRHV